MPLRAYPFFFFSLNFSSTLVFVRLSTLASADSIPGISTLYHKSLVQKIRDIKQFFGTQSVKPDALVAPLREMALELYLHMNDAIPKFVICMFSIFFPLYSHCLHPPGETKRIL